MFSLGRASTLSELLRKVPGGSLYCGSSRQPSLSRRDFCFAAGNFSGEFGLHFRTVAGAVSINPAILFPLCPFLFLFFFSFFSFLLFFFVFCFFPVLLFLLFFPFCFSFLSWFCSPFLSFFPLASFCSLAFLFFSFLSFFSFFFFSFFLLPFFAPFFFLFLLFYFSCSPFLLLFYLSVLISPFLSVSLFAPSFLILCSIPRPSCLFSEGLAEKVAC